MSEYAPSAIVDIQESIPQISAGLILKNAREAEGIQIASLATLLKVPVMKLEALEADRFDLLLDTVFVRALAASLCRTLKIDPESVLTKLPHSTVPTLKTDESGINTPFRTSGNSIGLSFFQQLSKPLFFAVIVLLVGVLVIIFFPLSQRFEITRTPKLEAVSAIAMQPVASLRAESTSSNELSTSSSSVETTRLINQSAVAASSSFLGAAVNAPPLIVTGSGATTGIVVIKAHGVTWIEIVDASKVVQVRKTMANGETVGASGVLPLLVVVGKADATEVQVRGKPFDLGSVAKDNVARFEVK